MMICEKCHEILKPEKTWGHHHVTTAKLVDAKGSGCVFCQKLAASAGVVHSEDDTKPLYRWTIRATAQNRETKSYTSITFRPVLDTGHKTDKSENLPEVRFDLFPEEDLGFIPDEESFGLGTDSEASQKQMKRWIDNCVESHPKCQPSHAGNAFMPTRVLDIGATNDPWPPLQIPVVKTSTIGDESRKYMTLSHCWGEKLFVNLTPERLKKFTNDGIPWGNSSSGNGISSSQNFVEAIKTTRRLGIRYLWIDSICIIQGDKEDWAVESKLMHKVYRNSYCNLAAVDSKDCLGGLFRGREHGVLPATYDPPRGSSHRLSGRKWRILTSDLWDKDLLGSPLYTRGWVFQERMLSPRLLQFGHSQMFWDCATISACEALPEGFPLSLDAKAASDRHWRQRLQEADITQRSPAKGSLGSLEMLWASSVSAYTACNLTRHSDKDDAMWGIAKLMRDMLGQEYAHGLWSTSLEEQLAWRVADRSKAVGPEKVQGNTDGEKGDSSNEISFPHWSWTRLSVPIQVVPRFRDRGRFYRATNHDGRKVSFQFKTPFSGWMKPEDFPGEEEFDRMTAKPINADEEHGKTQAESVSGKQTDPKGNAWKPDERSELDNEKIAIRGHACKGTLAFVPGEERWEVVIEGVQGDAVLEAFPDVEPLKHAAPCEFLVLTASRALLDGAGNEIVDTDSPNTDIIEDVQYSGRGILVKRVADTQLERVGMVEFRQLSGSDWGSFRLACGE
ncbi:hypothetical protein CSHISOI_03820, partial [Colletotrichum shisoi]